MTNKSILIIDTPKSCMNCQFRAHNALEHWCEQDKAQRCNTENVLWLNKPEWCPLVAMKDFIQKTKEVLDETAPRTGYCSVCCKYVNLKPQALNVYSEYFHDVDADGHPYDWRYRKTYRECVHCGHRILSDYITERKEDGMDN